jgi:DNA adenine methylase
MQGDPMTALPSPATPFLKWVGGKRQLLPEIRKHVPEKFGRYVEPFLGGGAVFFDLSPVGGTRLGDANGELVGTYRAVRDDVEEVIKTLHAHARLHSAKHYYHVRGLGSDLTGPALAARMIYLNKTGFNGLYRVNRSGGFNVPIGSYKNPTVCDEANLRACARALQGVDLVQADFTLVAEPARSGDFVYFDPPYVPVGGTSDFTSFTAAGFGIADQERLVDFAGRLKASGVHVLLSNADLPAVRELYRGFEMRAVQARRNINSNGGKRGAVGELLIW